MPRRTYMVLSERQQDDANQNWRIVVKGADEVLGHYQRQDDAIEEVRKIAKREHREGDDTQVLVQASSGECRTEWTYGHDPSPPKG